MRDARWNLSPALLTMPLPVPADAAPTARRDRVDADRSRTAEAGSGLPQGLGLHHPAASTLAGARGDALGLRDNQAGTATGTGAGAVAVPGRRLGALRSRRQVPRSALRRRSRAGRGGADLHALATNDLAGTRSLLTLLDSRHNELARDEAHDSTAQQQSDTVALVAKLLEFLRLPRKVAEVAAHLDISIARARNLLTEAVTANQVIVVAKRPATYQIAANGQTGDLFSSGN